MTKTDLFTTRQAYVEVIGGGYTVIDENKDPNSEIGMTIRKEEFIERIMQRYLYQNLSSKE